MCFFTDPQLTDTTTDRQVRSPTKIYKTHRDTPILIDTQRQLLFVELNERKSKQTQKRWNITSCQYSITRHICVICVIFESSNIYNVNIDWYFRFIVYSYIWHGFSLSDMWSYAQDIQGTYNQGSFAVGAFSEVRNDVTELHAYLVLLCLGAVVSFLTEVHVARHHFAPNLFTVQGFNDLLSASPAAVDQLICRFFVFFIFIFLLLLLFFLLLFVGEVLSASCLSVSCLSVNCRVTKPSQVHKGQLPRVGRWQQNTFYLSLEY